MGNIKQSLEKIEKVVDPMETAIAEWAIRCVSAEQEFRVCLNKMKKRYDTGEPTPLLTHDEILEKARALMWRYGTEEVIGRLPSNTRIARKLGSFSPR